MMKKYLILITLFLSHNFISAQQSIEYDKICYCSGNETPHSIISYDNNLEILLALKDSLSIQEIEERKIRYTKSQLKLLQLFNLIEKRDKEYYTTINILDTLQANNLRKDSKEIATLIYPEVKDDIKELVKYLNDSYSSRNEFSILFSYTLDGLIWDKFEENNITQPTTSNDHYLTWEGHFWMIPKPRNIKYGTNTSSNKLTTIYITNGIPWKYLKPFYDNYELTEKLILDINDYGRITDPDVIKTFEKFGIIDTTGILKVPLIYQDDQNKIYEYANLLAQKLLNQLIEKVSLDGLVDKYKFSDTETALIIFYHEFMWELMSILEREGIVKKPDILLNPDECSFKDMADMIFFVKKE